MACDGFACWWPTVLTWLFWAAVIGAVWAGRRFWWRRRAMLVLARWSPLLPPVWFALSIAACFEQAGGIGSSMPYSEPAMMVVAAGMLGFPVWVFAGVLLSRWAGRRLRARDAGDPAGGP